MGEEVEGVAAGEEGAPGGVAAEHQVRSLQGKFTLTSDLWILETTNDLTNLIPSVPEVMQPFLILL